MDLWLSLFSNIGVRLLLAKVNDGDVRNGIESGFLLLGVGTAVLAKSLKSASFFCFATLALIYSILLLFCKIFISIYWPSLSSRSIFINTSLIQLVSFEVKVSVTYSAFVDNKTTIAYFLEHKLTRPLFSIKTNLDINFLEMYSPAQSELEKFLIIKFLSSLSYIISKV